MNKGTLYILTLFSLTFFFSCGTTYELSETDLNYIPYKGNEVLVFKSDLNNVDTIFLNGLKNFTGCIDPLAIFPNKCEGKYISCTRTDPNYDRFLTDRKLVEIVATIDKETKISFDIALKGSLFYSLNSYSLNEFDKLPQIKLETENTIYEDVVVFNSDTYAQQFKERENYAHKFYWSKREGFIGV